MDVRGETKQVGGGILVPTRTSPGELLDRLSILTVKQEKLSGTEAGKIAHELHCDLHQFASDFLSQPGVSTHFERLIELNTELWEIEDKLRAMDSEVFPLMMKKWDVTQRYCTLASSVYQVNDARCLVKKKIDTMLGGTSEPKYYTAHGED